MLKPGGAFVAFDPNRRSPFMWLYRDKSSPLYSSKGVTPNERPIVAAEVRDVFSAAGFNVSTEYISLHFRHIASPLLKWLLPLYNQSESLLFKPAPLSTSRGFVLTYGVKPCPST